ncbi:MAG TPA: sugar phosphate isomerase/epimerase family protein [Candidatus Paceibacterota bacterium]|nr:sugar phosphate isomerase/epimerase family protein [Verrucomicrobiota bacterium]HRY49638.1 sugar phosphate isomerase/epimerase family protein [Candidatus Paceibacterota bacterium]HRZ99385.1 sugar phosphate isomerase/epimerase family protein [Candidatus Paceibacterota bacterium]
MLILGGIVGGWGCVASAGEAIPAGAVRPVNVLACRLSNYQGCEDAGWTHLPSIGVRHLFLNAPTLDQVASTKERLSDHGLQAVVLRGEADFSEPSCLDPLARQLSVCQEMGVRYLFLSVKRKATEKAVVYERLRRAGDLAKKHGVTLVLETHPDLGTNGDVQLETMRQVNHPNVRINFDTGNILYYNRDADVAKELGKIIEYVATVEVKDHNGEVESWHFPALGRGRVNFPAIFGILRERGYTGPVTMEIEGIKGIQRTRQEIERDIAESVVYLQSLSAFQLWLKSDMQGNSSKGKP